MKSEVVLQWPYNKVEITADIFTARKEHVTNLEVLKDICDITKDDRRLHISVDESFCNVGNYHLTKKCISLKKKLAVTGSKFYTKTSFMVALDDRGGVFPITLIPEGSLADLRHNDVGIHWQDDHNNWTNNQKKNSYFVYQRSPATMDSLIFYHVLSNYLIPLFRNRAHNLKTELPTIVLMGMYKHHCTNIIYQHRIGYLLNL